MSNLKVFLLVLLIVGSVRGQTEETPQDEAASCHNDFQAKMSSTTALRYSLKFANNEINELQASLNETNEMLNAAQRRKTELVTALMVKQVRELHTTCESVVAIDCCQIKTVFPLVNTGLFEIKDPCSGNNAFNFAKIRVCCDMETDGGGWIVIQRRNANFERVNFTRNWEDYVNGFGDLDGEFWIGLKNIYELTTQHEVELQISVWNDAESAITWNYQTFKISGPENKYRLTVSGGTGNGNRDAFAYHNGKYFTTYDRDNSGYNCGYKDQGGWWYYNCAYANLNGRHVMSGLPGIETRLEQMLVWYSSSRYEVYTNSIMMIRNKSCNLG